MTVIWALLIKGLPAISNLKSSCSSRFQQTRELQTSMEGIIEKVNEGDESRVKEVLRFFCEKVWLSSCVGFGYPLHLLVDQV